MISVGQVISAKYRLLRLLGDGGMGAVYEAQHEKLGTRVAIKILHPDIARRPGIVERFLQEARVSAQIKSPHVVSVTDVDQTADGLAYIVMELLEGEPLSRVLERDRKLPVATAVAYTNQILEALEAAHALGVVHRDLKPENVFVTTIAGKRVLKLIDFGIAKVRRDGLSEARNLTMAGVTMGTAEYMAPEQAFSADRADVRSDVYAVGVMLYEMISGTRPVMGDDARLIAVKVERGEVTPLVHAAPDAPREIAGACHRAMAARPELRFQSATEMRLALEGALQKRSIVGEAPMPQAVAVAQPAIDALGSTGKASPIDAALRDVPAGPTTQRGGAPVVFSTAQRTPVAPVDAYAEAPHLPPPAPPTAAPRRRRSGNGLLIGIIAVSLLLGAGVVVALVLSKQDDTHPVAPIDSLATVTPTPSSPSTSTAPTTPTTTDPLRPLNNTTPYVGPVNTGGQRIAADASAFDASALPGADAGTAANPFGIPSNFSFPGFPDAGIPVITLPSGFSLPTGFPGAPAPPSN